MNYVRLIGAGAVVLAVILVLWWAYSSGYASADLDRERAASNAVEKRTTIDKKVDAIPDDDLRRQLDRMR